MKILLVIASVALLSLATIGCVDSESPEAVSDSESPGEPPDSGSPAPPAQNRSKAEETYERAMGPDHGSSPEGMREAMAAMRKHPVFKNRFLGVWTLQNPTDAWVLMEIMYETKPQLIVEAGTFHGGSAVLWAIILEHIEPRGRVITIDIDDRRETRAKRIPIARKKVDFLLGSSTDPEIVAEVHRRAEGKRVMVLLDSLHSKEHVAAELAAYAPLVPVGGYIVVQDTQVGPIAAIEEFLAENDSFISDRTRERYADTNSVKGYLKRVAP